MRLLLNVRFPEGTFEVFGMSPAFSTPRENREFTEERAGGSEFSVLRGCLLEHLGRFSFLFSLLARIGNLWRGGRAVQNSRFSGIVSSRALWTLLHSPCENRGFVDRGLGGAELVILREDFSGEGELLFYHSNLSSAIR